ncbi:MFS transporter [Streptomyces sp. SKN60]|uniref:Cmx/CmrA family chloramphenicol efflux MFS transporter n=1 Tax=Streptomyces sp. SKN60 TaxID=2855506 RepID=UPI0022475132|nr:Cmx/CmrA family chloramphenicol efflux MFS transporter [Streptomyces sp. SKN60]MCX2182797.1 MFS transporter [Streptomyces sp. SKN60]
MPLFLHVLALAVFAQGTSEFMLSGLVPDLAHDLHVSPAAAAGLTAAYAVGMIIGAPLMAAAGARWPRRPALAGFLAAFVLVHVLGALTTDFAVLFATRAIAAVVNAGFLAVALPHAGSLVPAAHRARATALLLSGVTLACVVGVPAGALLGTAYGWRAAFWAVAALCLPALLLVLRPAPADHRPPARPANVSLRRELTALRSRPLRATLATAALVNGATFAGFAFLAVIATDHTGLPPAAVPGLLAAFGAGAFLGVTAAGRTTLRLPPALAALPAGWALTAALGAYPVPLFLLAAAQGALSFALGTTLVTRTLHLAPAAPSLSGAFATVALNTGAFAGPLLASATTTHTTTPLTALWTSTALAAVALACWAAARRAEGARRGAPH